MSDRRPPQGSPGGGARPGKLGRYQPPTVEDVPISPEERLLVPCKASGSFNPACLQACENCSSPGS